MNYRQYRAGDKIKLLSTSEHGIPGRYQGEIGEFVNVGGELKIKFANADEDPRSTWYFAVDQLDDTAAPWFEVGDLVEIRPLEDIKAQEESRLEIESGWNSEMDNLCGKRFTIENIYHVYTETPRGYRVSGHGWSWNISFNMIQLVLNQDGFVEGKHSDMGLVSLLRRHSDNPVCNEFLKFASSNDSPLFPEEKDLDYFRLPNKKNGLIGYVEKKKIKDGQAKYTFGKPVKVIQKVLGKKFSQDDLEKFAHIFKDIVVHKFELASTEKRFLYGYDGDNYVNQGPLGSSCMRYTKCQDWIKDFYCRNLDVVNLLIGFDIDGNIVGRALVWTLQSGKKFMDRIYYTSEKVCQEFIEYAKSNFAYYKQHQDNDCDSAWINCKTGEEKRMSEVFNIEYGEEFPYMDTFYYLDKENGAISNKASRLSGELFTIRSTEGELMDKNGNNIEDHEGERYCEYTSEWYDEDDVVSVEYGRYSYVHESHAHYLQFEQAYASPDVNVTYSYYYDNYVRDDYFAEVSHGSLTGSHIDERDSRFIYLDYSYGDEEINGYCLESDTVLVPGIGPVLLEHAENKNWEWQLIKTTEEVENENQ